MPNDAATYLVAVGPHKQTTADNLWKDDPLRSHSLSHARRRRRNTAITLAAATGHADKEHMKGNEHGWMVSRRISGLSRRTGINGRSPPANAGFSSLEPTLILRSQCVRASMTTCTVHEHLNEAGKRENPSVKRADCSLSRFDLDPQSILHVWSGDCRQGIPHCSHPQAARLKRECDCQAEPACAICTKRTQITECS